MKYPAKVEDIILDFVKRAGKEPDNQTKELFRKIVEIANIAYEDGWQDGLEKAGNLE